MSLGLNPQQDQAVRHPGGPLMVLAGAGSGKTRVLVHRIAELVRNGVPAHRILAVTFTNKAAGEMRERLVSMLGYDARAMWISTFHSTCAKLLRIHHDRVGLSQRFAIYDDDDQKKVINAILKQEGLSDSVTPRTVQVFIDRAKNKGEDPMDQFTGNYADDILRQVYPLYRDRLAREDAVDFNDLLLKVVELCKHKEAGKTLAEMFDHVLVDEFQDTNLVQYALVRHFVRLTRNLTVVGDDDQSIYSWRGAEPRNLLDFDRDFRDATAVRLEQNYRSSGMILAAANAVISRNFDRHEKTLWTDRDPGDPILWEETADERTEADFVARAIQGLIADDGCALGDFALLYRTHAQSRILEEMMRAHGLPYRIVGGVSFFQRKEVKDIRSYLRLVTNPQADLAFERIVNVPTRGIGKTTVERLRSFAKQDGVSLFEAAKAAGAGKVSTIKGAAPKKLAAFISLIHGLGDVVSAGASVAEVIIQAVERSTYRSRLEQEDTPEARDRLQNLSELVNMASDFDDETDGEGTLSEFDERISLASVSDQEDGRGSSVTLMTIHAAKGLEFPIVFVCGMEDGLFPSLRERDFEQDKAIEEERRLAYVAFTRAEDRLILTSTRARRVWNELKLNRPSRFVDEIPSDCLAVRERPQMSQESYRERLQAGSRSSSRQEYSEPDYDFDQSTYYDDVPDFDVGDDEEDGDFSAGSTVRHSTFGAGRVIESQGAGRDQKLLINFPSVGLKKVLARFVTR